VDNASRLTRLISLGEGNLRNMQLSPDGKWIVLGTENGLLVLDSTTLKRVLFLPISMKPATISFIENETKLTARDSTEGYVWTIPDGKLISHVHFMCIDATGKNNYCESIPDENMEYAFGLSYSVLGWPPPTYSNFLAGLYRTSDGGIQYMVDYKVKRIAHSPDYKLLALCTDDKLVLMQFQDGKVITEIPATSVKSAFFYPDGKTLAIVSQNQIKMLSMDDFHVIDTVYANGINSYFFSPDNSVMVIMTTGKIIRLLRTEDRLLINGITGISLTFTSDNQGFIVDDGNGRINQYHLTSDRSKIEFINAFSGEGVYLDFSYYKYYDSYAFQYSQNESPNSAGVFSADNTKVLVVNPGDKNQGSSLMHSEIYIYDVSTGSLINRYPDFSYPLFSGALWLPSLNTFAVLIEELTAGTSLITLDLQSGSFTKIIDNRKVTRQAVNFSTKSDLLVIAQGNSVLSWDLKNSGYWQLPISPDDLSNSSSRTKIGFSPDGKTISISDTLGVTHFISSVDYSAINTSLQNKFLYLNNGYYGWINGNELYRRNEQGIDLQPFEVGPVYDLDFNSARNLLATVSVAGLKVWDLSDLTREKILFSDKLTKFVNYFGSVSFSPDGNYVAAETEDAVAIWRTNDGQLIYKLWSGYWMEFAFSADSKMIAISGNGGFDSSQVSLFDLSTGKSIFSTGWDSFQGSISNPPKLSFSPDGKYMAVLPAFGFVSIWGIP
jgi:hypothetical protein